MIRRFALALVSGASLLAAANISIANTLFTDQASPSTGTFEWNKFTATTDVKAEYYAAHAPNLSSGVGAATVKGGVIPPGPLFPPDPQVFMGSLYTGSAKGRFTTSLSSISTTEPNTTVVMQIAMDASGGGGISNSTLLLGGAAPTEFVDRGDAGGLIYYWAEWQLPAAATYTALFDAPAMHSALAGVQVDYYNGATAFNAVAPGVVPEPTTLAMAGLGLLGFAALRRRATA